MLLKISQKSQKNICAGVSFLIKAQTGGLQLYYKETPVLVFFVNSAKIKNPYVGNVCERLLLRVKFLRVSFHKVLAFYFVDDCFTYISLKFPESLNRLVF